MLVSGHMVRDETERKPQREADVFLLMGWLFILGLLLLSLLAEIPCCMGLIPAAQGLTFLSLSSIICIMI